MSVVRFQGQEFPRQVSNALATLVNNGWTHKVFNANPLDGRVSSFPCAPISQPYQINTLQATSVFDATTSSGFFLWLPAWMEKVFCWHVPADAASKTFGTPTPIYYSMDTDQFYERYRVVCSILTIQAGTVSTTNAGLSGDFNAVSAYNSISSLIGNGTTTFQIYSYENALGLTPDVQSKIGAIRAWDGISMLFVNHPDTPFGRLEDSVVYSTQDLDPAASAAKFTNSTDNYNLDVLGTLSSAALTPASLVSGGSKIYNLGNYLVDGIRASTINYSYSVTHEYAFVNPLGAADKVRYTLRYEAYDLTGTLTDAGDLSVVEGFLPAVAGSSETSYESVISGSKPDCYNVSENQLSMPKRELRFKFIVENLFGVDKIYVPNFFQFRINHPVINGLTIGIIQEPKFVFYNGIEIGSKISISGATRIEAMANSATARFVATRNRDYRELEVAALKRVLADPAEYGIRWAVSAADRSQLIENFTNGLLMAAESTPEGAFLSCMAQITNMLQMKSRLPNHEASIRSVLKRGMRHVGKIGKDVFNSSIKPVIDSELQILKDLPATAARDLVSRALSSVAGTYQPPKITNYTGSHQAASGFMASDSNLSPPMRGYTRSYYDASTRNAPIKVIPKKIEFQSVEKELTVPISKVNLFPTVNIIDDEITDDEFNSCVDAFAIVPLECIPNNSFKSMNFFVCPNGKKIYNYSLYNIQDCDSLQSYPDKDVVLLRVSKISHATDKLTVTTTLKPVGGRSLELAIYMFNNKVHGTFLFTGAVDRGKVLPMCDPMAALKQSYATLNKLTTIGNGNFDVRVTSCMEALTIMRKVFTPKLSNKHYNAAVTLDLLKYQTNLKVTLKPYIIPKSLLTFADEDNIPDNFIGPYYSLPDPIKDRCLLLSHCEIIDQSQPKSPVIVASTKHDDNSYSYLLTITPHELHNYNKLILLEKWNVQVPLCKDIIPNQTNPFAVPIAMTDTLPPLNNQKPRKKKSLKFSDMRSYAIRQGQTAVVATHPARTISNLKKKFLSPGTPLQQIFDPYFFYNANPDDNDFVALASGYKSYKDNNPNWFDPIVFHSINEARKHPAYVYGRLVCVPGFIEDYKVKPNFIFTKGFKKYQSFLSREIPRNRLPIVKNEELTQPPNRKLNERSHRQKTQALEPLASNVIPDSTTEEVHEEPPDHLEAANGVIQALSDEKDN